MKIFCLSLYGSGTHSINENAASLNWSLLVRKESDVKRSGARDFLISAGGYSILISRACIGRILQFLPVPNSIPIALHADGTGVLFFEHS